MQQEQETETWTVGRLDRDIGGSSHHPGADPAGGVLVVRTGRSADRRRHMAAQEL